MIGEDAVDPGRLRKVMCGTCGNETGEEAVNPIGICHGCKVLAQYGVVDFAQGGVDHPAFILEDEGEADYDEDYEDEDEDN